MVCSESRTVAQRAEAATADVTEIVTGGVAAGTADSLAELEQLREAMLSRAVIEQARGMLMALVPCSDRTAWSLLVEISQHSNVKLREVAAALVGAAGGAALPPEVEPACRRTLVEAARTERQGTDLFRQG